MCGIKLQDLFIDQPVQESAGRAESMARRGWAILVEVRQGTQMRARQLVR